MPNTGKLKKSKSSLFIHWLRRSFKVNVIIAWSETEWLDAFEGFNCYCNQVLLLHEQIEDEDTMFELIDDFNVEMEARRL